MLSCSILSQNDRGPGQIFLVIYNPQTYDLSFSWPFFRIFFFITVAKIIVFHVIDMVGVVSQGWLTIPCYKKCVEGWCRKHVL